MLGWKYHEKKLQENEQKIGVCRDPFVCFHEGYVPLQVQVQTSPHGGSEAVGGRRGQAPR